MDCSLWVGAKYQRSAQSCLGGFVEGVPSGRQFCIPSRFGAKRLGNCGIALRSIQSEPTIPIVMLFLKCLSFLLFWEKLHETHETIFCGRAVKVVNLWDVGRGILSRVRFFKNLLGCKRDTSRPLAASNLFGWSVCFFLKSLESSEMCWMSWIRGFVGWMY